MTIDYRCWLIYGKESPGAGFLRLLITGAGFFVTSNRQEQIFLRRVIEEHDAKVLSICPFMQKHLRK